MLHPRELLLQEEDLLRLHHLRLPFVGGLTTSPRRRLPMLLTS
jgi:hypothetical protein